MKQPLELTVMMYHYVRERGDDAEAESGIPGMSVKAFNAQLDELSRKHTFVTWPEARLALQEDKPLPSSACLLTFDDGVRDHYLNVFKILHDRKLSGLFFVLARHQNDGLILGHKIHFLLAKLGLDEFRAAILKKLNSTQREQFTSAEKQYQLSYPNNSPDGEINRFKAVLQRNLSVEVDPLLHDLLEMYVGSESEISKSYYLNSEQINEMRTGGMHFGGHSRSHPWLDWIDIAQKNEEIISSADYLRHIEVEPWAFAYPYGGLSEDTPHLLKKHGFIAAFTTHAQLRHDDPYFIGRFDGEEVAQNGRAYA